jgi:osmoprotectant transport system permease protein
VIPALAAIMALLLPLGFIGVAPNRLLPGEGVSAMAAMGFWLVVPVALLGLGAWRRLPGWAGAAAAGLAVVAMLGLAGMAAAERLADLAPAARASFGAGFWVAVAAGLALVAMRGAWMGLAVAAGAVMLWWLGWLDRLSLVVEATARADALRAAIWTHLALAGAALALALLVAVPLAWAGFRRPRIGAVMGAALSGVQVVPAIALFALLIPLLAALLRAVPALREWGLGAVGWLPAVLATAAYLALPLWRSLSGGLAAADPAAVQAAEAMGMTEGRILVEVRLPLALPVFAGGLRVAVVQAIGLVTLGGLVGAGGLGALVFEGLSQFATDLMLLGALPILVLALAADTLARAAETRLGRPA